MDDIDTNSATSVCFAFSLVVYVVLKPMCLYLMSINFDDFQVNSHGSCVTLNSCAIHNNDTQMFDSGFSQEMKWLYPFSTQTGAVNQFPVIRERERV